MLNCNYLLLLMLSVVLVGSVSAAETKIEGVYLGRNLFVRNPFDAERESFCISEIYVNERLVLTNPSTSAIQVPLNDLQLNDRVAIRIVHDENCAPEIVNPEVINSSNSFSFLYFQIDENSINWITRGEALKGEFTVEQLKYTGWKEIFSREGKGKLDYNQYFIEARNYAGENRYRITYTPKDAESVQSQEVEYFSLLEPVDFYPSDSVTEWISLTRDADYFILDADGNLLKSGFNNTINVSDLDYGEYRIVVENDEDLFYKPKPKIVPRKKKN